MNGMDLQFSIISYAVVSAKYEANNNLIESFLPLVEHVLLGVDRDYIKEIEIADIYEEIYGYRIHSAILSQLLRILQHQKKIDRLKGECIEIYKPKLSVYESKEKHEQNFRSLVCEISLFLKRKGKSSNREEITRSIVDFLRKNALDFNSFINYQSNLEDIKDENLLFNDLVEFLIEERRNDTSHYTFFKDLYFGIVLSYMIIASDESTIPLSEKFHIENVLLDSNYIFRLIDLQTQLEHQAAKDTFEALKGMNCSFWVCKETIKQIVDTLRSITKHHSETATTVLSRYGDEKFTGLSSAFIRRRLTAVAVEEIIDNLENVLTTEYNINIIDENEFNIDQIDTTSDDYKTLSAVKIDTYDSGIIHDLLLIAVVRQKRPRSLYKADEAGWWVLTDDNKLTRWNAKHLSTSNIAECITESQLATVLWICNPKVATLDGLFNTAIALRSQQLIGNSDYIRISKEIERQKTRFSDNAPKVKKLALVLSQKLLSLNDLLNDDPNEVDVLFDQLLADSQSTTVALENELQEKESLIQKKEAQVEDLSEKVIIRDSLLSEATEHLLKSLNEQKQSKEQHRDSIQDRVNEIEKTKNTINNVVLWILRGIMLLVAIGILLWLRPLAERHNDWYAKNQLWIDSIAFLLPLILSLLGIKSNFITNICQYFVKILLGFGVKLHIVKNHKSQIDSLNAQIQALNNDIAKIQDEIEAVLL